MRISLSKNSKIKLFLFSKQSTLLAFMCLSFMISGLQAAMASMRAQEEKYYCSPVYGEVKKVIFTHEAKLPYESINWPKVMHYLSSGAKDMLSKGNIEMVVAKAGSVDVADIPHDTLLIKIVYSHADKNSFSIPLDNDIDSVWLELYRSSETSSLTYPYKFKTLWLNGLEDRVEPGSFEQSMSLAAPMTLLFPAACAVLFNSAQMKCTNQSDWSKNEIIPYPHECEERVIDPELKEAFDLLRQEN